MLVLTWSLYAELNHTMFLFLDILVEPLVFTCSNSPANPRLASPLYNRGSFFKFLLIVRKLQEAVVWQFGIDGICFLITCWWFVLVTKGLILKHATAKNFMIYIFAKIIKLFKTNITQLPHKTLKYSTK